LLGSFPEGSTGFFKDVLEKGPDVMAFYYGSKSPQPFPDKAEIKAKSLANENPLHVFDIPRPTSDTFVDDEVFRANETD
jgi:hypothetical protein